MCPLLASAVETTSVRLVISEDSLLAKEIAEKLVKELDKGVPGVVIETGARPVERFMGRRLVITIGESAWISTLSDAAANREAPVLAVIPSPSSYESRPKKAFAGSSAIYLNQPMTRVLNLATLVGPRNAIVGIVAGPTTQPQLAAAEGHARERGLRLVAESASDEMSVGRAVARIVRETDILLAVPDQVVHSSNTVHPVLLLTYRAGIPVIAYSAAYLRAGATLVLYSTAEQIAQQALESVVAFHQGKILAAVQAPRYFIVEINPTVARSLGISLPTAAELQAKLQTMKE